eukprot:m.23614 g.23614  ORF g.23614 m.23614 type:complete len:50 (+) comp5972_c0_seq2:87-236(+)
MPSFVPSSVEVRSMTQSIDGPSRSPVVEDHNVRTPSKEICMCGEFRLAE